MNGRRIDHRFLAALAISAGLSGVAVAEAPSKASSGDVKLVPVVGQAKAQLLRSLSAHAAKQSFSPAHHECPGGTPHVQGITCNSTNTQQLANTDCSLNDGSFVDFYSFSGTAGQQVTIDLTAGFDTYLFLLDPNADVVDENDDRSDTDTNSRIVFTLTSTGTWFIAANSFAANQFGPYTLVLNCTGGGGGGACTPNSTTLCLNNSRFRVTANWATTQGTSGAAVAVPETSDTGMFWFFTANNIEMIIKVVNGCGFNQRYWVFAAGLTNVQVDITVTDTSNNTTRTYSNPQGTAFAPIQDTAAFATCP